MDVFHMIPAKILPYEMPLIGEVEKIFTTYGFVSTIEGNRYFFHFGTCASKPELLKVGDKVEFYVGEDAKTHRFHAQRVRKIIMETTSPVQTPSPTTAAILNTLPPAAVFVRWFTVTPAPNLIPVSQMALANGMMASMPCTSTAPPVTSTTMVAPAMVITPSMQGNDQVVMSNANQPKRAPLRQIMPEQRQLQVNGRIGLEKPKDVNDWDAVLFKPFTVGPSMNAQNQVDGVNLTAFERARMAWYAVNDP